ncbi:MAG: TylF/MycF/NovP-related O-methyltransferase [bacterium]|nr:TylF/MycF/NovP-related O-methyltransferase [bacterium]
MNIKEATQWTTPHPVPVGWMKQFRYFLTLFSRISNVPGDVVECGIGEGNTFTMLAYLVGSENAAPKRRLLGFDSFEGFPEPDPRDVSPRDPQKGEWKIAEEVVRTRLEESKILKTFPDLDFLITKGFLNETLPEFPDRQIAFLHIDVDLYAGYRDALNFLFPKVVSGGIVLFDEYKDFPNRPEYGSGTIDKWPGCTQAVDEYFKDRPEKIEYYPEMKKYYVVKS